MKAMDRLPGHLREMIGVRGVALSSVIRENATPGNVPPLARNSVTSDEYTSIMDEIIDFCPHQGPEYAEDNTAVLQVLVEMTKDTSRTSSIEPFVSRRDGRGAYFALSQHNMGNSTFEDLVSTAEKYVLSRILNGSNVRYSLKQHITKHREAYNGMVRASQHIVYALPEGRTRVSRLLTSIVTTEPNICSAKIEIMSNPTMMGDFEAAAEFLILICPKKKDNNHQGHRIVAIKTGGSKGKRKRDNNCEKGKTGVPLRYHTVREYQRLNADQKKELKEWKAKKNENKAQLVSQVETLTQIK